MSMKIPLTPAGIETATFRLLTQYLNHFMSMKIPLTPAGIETATFRFVAQYLNHCATAVLLCGTGGFFIYSTDPQFFNRDTVKTKQKIMAEGGENIIK